MAVVVSGTPTIINGLIDLYKYEPFSLVFTVVGTGTLQFLRSSAQLNVYSSLSVDKKTFTFESIPGPPASYASPFNLIVDLMSGTTIVSSTTYSVTISAARLVLTPSSPYLLDKFVNVSNTLGSVITVTGSNAPDSLVSTPGLPPGLSFSGLSIVGVPQLEQAARNYLLIGSNSTNGTISTANISVRVGPPVVRILPSLASFSNLTATSTPTTTFTALLPANIYLQSFVYMWSPPLPSGLVFTDISNVVQPYTTPFTPTDSNRTIKLAGSPDLTDAFNFPSSGLVTVVLSGYYRDATNFQTTGSSTLYFQFAETVLMSTSVSSTLYVGKVLGTADIVITAASYFPSTSVIDTFTITGTPPGLSLSQITPTRWILTGTPTTSGTTSYIATATNFNGLTTSIAVPITINPDVVTFTSAPPDPTYVVSRPVVANSFQVQARATSEVVPGSTITYTSSFDFATVGLTFNATTGNLSGTPTSNFIGSVVFTATDSLGASNSFTDTVSILQDVFTWPTYVPAYFQNRLITPVQLVVTTLSGRPIQSFSSVGAMPAGLSISPSGLISGTYTGAVPGNFTIRATTGYQSPPTATQIYYYTVQPDNFLLLQENAVDAIGVTFSNIQFRTLQYSKDVFVNPTYTLTNVYPTEYPAPVVTMTSSGVLSGDFSGGPVFPTYLGDITATLASVTSSTSVVFSFSNTPTPLLIAGYTNTGVSNVGHVGTTTNYVFSATSSGNQLVSNQGWSGDLPSNGYLSDGYLYPDLAQYSNTFIAVNVSNVYDGVYNAGTNGVDWTETNPQDALIPYSLSPIIGRYTNIASDGTGGWLLLQSGGLGDGDFRIFTRYLTPEWDTTASMYTRLNEGGNTTMTYIGGKWIVGQVFEPATSNAGYDPGYSSILIGTVDVRTRPPTASWTVPTVAPDMAAVLRFAISNTTLVAVGNGWNASPAISYSTNLGVNWTSPSAPSFMNGSNVILNDILFAANTWVTCGLDSNGSNMIAYSSNLSNWVKYPIAASNSNVRWSAIAFNANAWTIAGNRTLSGSNQSTILSLDATAWPNQQVSLDPLSGSIQFGVSGTPLFSRILSTSFSNGTPSGIMYIPPGTLTFTQPTQSNFVLYQYVPYSFQFVATGAAEFIYYYGVNTPIGFQFVLDSGGVFATLTGISPSNQSSSITVYAKTANSAAVPFQLRLNTIIPFFVNPQSGAGAYTAIVRTHVDADAAQNARDSRVFPEVNPLAGPFMAPRAPDTVTMSNCFLGLCRKPCPTCRTTM